jgi:hypothetical protein
MRRGELVSSVRLPLRRAALLLEWTAGGWCAVHLEQRGQRVHLGSDAISTVAPRLLANVERPQGAAAGEIEGRPVWWVLSLSERHSSIYCGFRGADRDLVVQGREAERLWQGGLSEDDWRAWRTALSPLCQGTAHDGDPA